MKKLIKLSVLLSLFASCATFIGCKPEEQPNNSDPETPSIGDFDISVKEIGPDYVDLFVTAPNALEMAYNYSTEGLLETPLTLFGSGVVISVEPGEVFRIKELQSDTKYYFNAVARLSDAEFSRKVEFTFTTAKFNYTDLITIIETYNDGYKAHITVPQSAKDAGNVIRYGSMPVAYYNYLKGTKLSQYVDLQSVVANGNPYGNYVKNDSTIVINDLNVVELDENGEPVIDEETGETVDIHDPIVPNEPTVLFAGECRWGTPEEYAEIMGFYAPTKDSYSIALWDPETMEWFGAFSKVEFVSKQSETVDLDFEIEIPEDEIDVIDAMVYFNVGPDVKKYFYMIADEATYNQIIQIYLGGNEDWLQWYLTSYMAFREFGIYENNKSVSVNAASSFIEPLTGGEKYYVMATVFGDDLGLQQEFYKTSFTAKEKTKKAPVIEVTSIQNGDPFNATFNIKAPNKDVVGAYWACNYAREFEMLLNADYTYPQILKGNYTFDSSEIKQINSNEGLTLSLYTLDGETTRFAVYGCNDEYTFNAIDADKNTKAWADYIAPYYESGKTVLNSPVLDKLEGDWTSKTTVIARELAPDGESVISYNLEHTAKVTISKTAPVLPETLTDDVYSLYPNKDAADVNDMFAALKDLSGQFTDYRLTQNNRVLCTGFHDFDPNKRDFGLSRMEYRGPFELFTATDYTSQDVSQLIYDFGPKWYLEVLEDGSVIAPFTSTYLPPMHNWPLYTKYSWTSYTFYLGGVGNGSGILEATAEYPGFPVEISDDYQTITIKPLVVKDGGKTVSYYMNSLGVNPSDPSQMDVLATIISDIVLTKGWDGEETRSNAKLVSSKVKPMSVDGTPMAELPQPKVMKSMTKLEPKPRIEYEVDETPNVVTMDMVNAAGERILKHFGLAE